VIEKPGAAALLMELVEGEELGSLVVRVPPAEAEGAWIAAGKALRLVHQITERYAVSLGCEAVGMPPGSRGRYHVDEMLAVLERLLASRPDLGDYKGLAEIVERALPLYESAPRSLVQSDTHLSQFLVRRDGLGWRCTAILDWEHADLDDPDWDLARLDVFRWNDFGFTPPAFFAGYGRAPKQPLRDLYRFYGAAWVLDAAARGATWVTASCRLAEETVRGLTGRLETLREEVEEHL
jgi:aminoglycoside phosphotransferase (APT) family kinase protein